MSLTPTLPEPIHVICFCTCSYLHPDQVGICDARNPIVVVEERSMNGIRHVLICQPCADALYVLL
jgi:hypothetical protein